MKTRNFLTVVLAMAAVFFFVNGVYADDGEVVAQFSKELSAQEVGGVVALSGIEPKEIYFQQGEIQGGYTLKPYESIMQAVEHLVRKHDEALNNMLAEVEKEQSIITQKDKKDRYEKLHRSLVGSLNETRSQGLKINAVRVLNTPALQELLIDGVVESIKAVPVSSRRNKDNNLNIQGETSLLNSFFNFFVSKAYAAMYYVQEIYWAPRSGASKTTQSMAYNSFSFTDASGFDLFGGILTYEHETQVYDKDFADYDDYWSSNLPSAYYDTPFCDSIDNFTVGSSQASSIQENTQYWTYMSLTAGSASSAGVIIKGQLGHRSPSWCHSTWCIYSDMTTGWLCDYDAPISTQQSWTYNPQ